jgi:hypothetical protein
VGGDVQHRSGTINGGTGREPASEESLLSKRDIVEDDGRQIGSGEDGVGGRVKKGLDKGLDTRRMS